MNSYPSFPDPLLNAQGVGLSRGGRVILRDVSLQVLPAQVVVVIGPNGAGKTSLIRVLTGLEKPSTGRVHKARSLRIGYMPQHLRVDPVLPLSVQRFLTLHRRVDASRLRAALEEVGVPDRLQSPMQILSGGEMQRVMLARALLQDPDLLVLDEPAQGVDVIGQSEVFRLIDRLRRRIGCGVLMVSHELHLVMAAADHVVCINQHVCCTGSPEAVSQNSEYRRLFPDANLRGIGLYRHHHDHRHDLAGHIHQVRATTPSPEGVEGTAPLAPVHRSASAQE